jgi:1,2-diacylglycerol 3-alpha-glucosyltransferase/glucuronosyltransferase
VKIAIVIDTWLPEVNGVVVTMQHTVQELTERGHEVVMITPQGFRTIGMPGYSSIRLALFPGRGVARVLDAERPDSIHISTEGPLGMAARHYCIKRGLDFTTCYHTRFPEYIRARAPVPLSVSYAWFRRFHKAARRVMVSTPSLARDLAASGFSNIVLWNKGVDTELFRPRTESFLSDERPIWMYVGRVAIEKNIRAFLSLELPGTQYVVGDGPDLAGLKARYSSARFTGFLMGQDLARHLAAADVMVFPSRTDTYGLVQLEAMACGVPVAAFPVTGPLDVIEQGVTGFCDEDLRHAALACLELDGTRCRDYALNHGWSQVATQFLEYMVPATPVSQKLAS